MSAIAALDKGYKKQDRTTDKGIALGQKTLRAWHKFSSSGLTDIDITSLTMPTELSSIGLTNPNTANLLAANIFVLSENVRVESSIHGLLQQGLSYDIPTSNIIRLKGAAVSAVGEIITITIVPVNMTGIIGVDAQALVQTGTVGLGQTDIVLSAGYFTYNKYASQQMGDVMLILDGISQMRNIGNSVSGDGNYIEVAPGSGNLSNTLRLNTAPSLATKSYIIISNGLVAERPTAAVLGAVQTLAATVDQLVQDVAYTTGNPTSRYQAAPSSVDQAMFGSKVNSIFSGMIYDAVVGTSAQLAAGQCTHTTLQAAINALSSGGRILYGTSTTETIAISTPNLLIEGKGRGSLLTGTLTLNSGAVGNCIKTLKVSGNITLNSGANDNFLDTLFYGASLTNSGSGNLVTQVIAF